MLTVDQLNQAVATAQLLQAVQGLSSRASGSVQFAFPDGRGFSAAISDSGFMAAFSDFLTAQQVALVNRLQALGITA